MTTEDISTGRPRSSSTSRPKIVSTATSFKQLSPKPQNLPLPLSKVVDSDVLSGANILISQGKISKENLPASPLPLRGDKVKEGKEDTESASPNPNSNSNPNRVGLGDAQTSKKRKLLPYVLVPSPKRDHGHSHRHAHRSVDAGASASASAKRRKSHHHHHHGVPSTNSASGSGSGSGSQVLRDQIVIKRASGPTLSSTTTIDGERKAEKGEKEKEKGEKEKEKPGNSLAAALFQQFSNNDPRPTSGSRSVSVSVSVPRSGSASARHGPVAKGGVNDIAERDRARSDLGEQNLKRKRKRESEGEGEGEGERTHPTRGSTPDELLLTPEVQYQEANSNGFAPSRLRGRDRYDSEDRHDRGRGSFSRVGGFELQLQEDIRTESQTAGAATSNADADADTDRAATPDRQVLAQSGLDADHEVQDGDKDDADEALGLDAKTQKGPTRHAYILPPPSLLSSSFTRREHRILTHSLLRAQHTPHSHLGSGRYTPPSYPQVDWTQLPYVLKEVKERGANGTRNESRAERYMKILEGAYGVGDVWRGHGRKPPMVPRTSSNTGSVAAGNGPQVKGKTSRVIRSSPSPSEEEESEPESEEDGLLAVVDLVDDAPVIHEQEPENGTEASDHDASSSSTVQPITPPDEPLSVSVAVAVSEPGPVAVSGISNGEGVEGDRAQINIVVNETENDNAAVVGGEPQIPKPVVPFGMGTIDPRKLGRPEYASSASEPALAPAAQANSASASIPAHSNGDERANDAGLMTSTSSEAPSGTSSSSSSSDNFRVKNLRVWDIVNGPLHDSELGQFVSSTSGSGSAISGPLNLNVKHDDDGKEYIGVGGTNAPSNPDPTSNINEDLAHPGFSESQSQSHDDNSLPLNASSRARDEPPTSLVPVSYTEINSNTHTEAPTPTSKSNPPVHHIRWFNTDEWKSAFRRVVSGKREISLEDLIGTFEALEVIESMVKELQPTDAQALVENVKEYLVLMKDLPDGYIPYDDQFLLRERSRNLLKSVYGSN